MGAAIEIVDTFVTNPGAGAPVNTAVFPGDTQVVRNFENPSSAYLCAVWASEATAGIARLTSPRLHDNVQGLRFRTVAGQNRDLLPDGVFQRLYAQDQLVGALSGGAAETDGLSWLNYYDDMPGMSPRLSSWESIAPRVVNLVNVEVANGGGAAVGQRSASAALNATFDLLIADTDYALLGYESDVNGLSVGIRGVDTGNLRLGGPMTTERIETRGWFVELAETLGKPCIPVLSSANKAGILIDNAQVVAGVAANITLILAQLAP